MGRELLLIHQSKIKIICVMCVSGGPRWFDTDSLRRQLVLMVKNRGYEPALVSQNVIDYPRDLLSAKEQALRALTLDSICTHRFEEIWIAGMITSDFVRETIVRAHVHSVQFRSFSQKRSVLRRYMSWFRPHEVTGQALRA